MKAHQQPSIELFDLKVMEPVTTLTDLIVAATCFLGVWIIYRNKVKGKTVMYMKWYFFVMGLATLMGGLIGHAFLYAFSFGWKLTGWYTSMIAITLIERSSIEHARKYIKPLYGNILLVVNIIELFTFMTITAVTLDFKYVEIHSVYGLMIVVFSLHLYVYLKTRDKGSKMILYAVGVVALAALVFNLPISLHKWFNHNDLAHVLMVIGTVILIKGTFYMKEVKKQIPPSEVDIL